MKEIKKPLSILLTICMIVGMIPWTTTPALAANAVTYPDENGKTHTVTSYKELTFDRTTFGGGVWVAKYSGTGAKDLSLTADTVLIVNNAFTCDSIYLGGHSLTIYGTAKLFVYKNGISGPGTLTLCSGMVEALTQTPNYPAFGARGGAFIKGGSLLATANL